MGKNDSDGFNTLCPYQTRHQQLRILLTMAHRHHHHVALDDIDNSGTHNNVPNNTTPTEPIVSGDSKIDAEIQAAFLHAANDLTYTLKPEDEKEIKKYILTSPAYVELQAYIHLGITTTCKRDEQVQDFD